MRPTWLLFSMALILGCGKPAPSGSGHPSTPDPAAEGEATHSDALDSAASPVTPPPAEDQIEVRLVEVPRPNSGTYTTQEAEQLLPEYLARSTGVGTDHPLAKSFQHGIHVHLNQQDAIQCVDFFGKDASGFSGLTESLDSIIAYGNPRSVLLTSESKGWNSETRRKVVDYLFQPSVQLFILEQVDP